MSRFNKFILLSLVMVLIFIVAACGKEEEENQLEIPAKQVTVIDGDTIRIDMKNRVETVRLLLVDAPEMNDNKYGKQPFADEATTYLRFLIQSSKTITLEKDVSSRDPYKRFLAYVYADKKSVQEALLEKGLVRVYQDPKNDKYLKEYKQIEAEARNKKIGIWSLDNYVQANGFHPEAVHPQSNEQTGFVASTNSDVYHPISCKEVVDTIKEENRIYFKTEQEAQDKGYKRSKVKGCWE